MEKNKKKILFVINSLKIWWWAEKIVADVWTKLYENWFDVYYLTFYDDENTFLYLFKGKHIKIWWNSSKKANFLKKLVNLFKKAYYIKKYSKLYNIDIVISSMEDSDIPNIFSKLIFLNKSKSYIWVHNSKKYLYLLSKIFYRFADKIITIVNEERNKLINKFWIKSDKIITIYNSINLQNIQKLSKEKLGEYEELLNNWKFTFINIWRLTEQKNQRLLIDTFANFNKKYPDTQLIVLWEGELRKELEKQISDLNLEDKVFLLWIQKNPYKFLSNSNCFVFTSKWEWFGLVLIEALACWLPIISSDCSTWPTEILREGWDYKKVNKVNVENYWILFPEWNKDELLKAMEMIYLNKDLREKLKQKAIKRAEYFDINKIIKKWGNLLKKDS